MARISDEDIARVRDATDIVSLISQSIVLKPKGRLHWGLCPFHGEKTPSFKVDSSTQLWHCFGCGRGGDVFGYVMESEHMEFPDAVMLLADRAHIEIERQEGGVSRGEKEVLIDACEEAAAFYADFLSKSPGSGPQAARAYLSGRGLGSATAKAWGLGYAPGRGALCTHLMAKGFTYDQLVSANLAVGNASARKDRFYERIMFPISDLSGRVVAFGGRVVHSGEPKYLNTNDTPIFKKSTLLYAIDRAKGPITATGTAVIVEGYTDVIALHEAGITNVVATLGTALSAQHLRLLGRFARKVVYLFDGDEAGLRAADRASEFLDSDVTPEAGDRRVDLMVAVLPAGLDPADFIAASGPDAMRKQLEQAVPLIRFAIDRRLARWDLDRPEERTRALKDACEVLRPVRDSLLADDYANYIADRLRADFALVKASIPRERGPARGADSSEASAGVGVREVSDPRVSVERDLLELLVSEARLRNRAQELLARELLVVPEHRAMCEVIVAVDPSTPPAQLLGMIEARVPGASASMSRGSVESSAEIDVVFSGLVSRIKEFELERRIADGKARLKLLVSETEKEESDRLFQEIATLQRELDALRRNQQGLET